MKTLIKVTTVPESLLAFHKGHGDLLNRWFNVIAVSSGGPELEAFSLRENIRTIPLNMNRRISVFADFVSVYKMYKIFRQEKPYIVHSMTPKAGLVSMLAAYLARVPNRIHTFTGLIFPTEKGLKRFILINIDRLICFCATRIIPEGNGVKNDLIQNHVTKKELKIVANGNFNGIDLEYFNPKLFSKEFRSGFRKQISLKDENFVFTFIGRIVRDKGVEELLTAFCSLAVDHPEIRLLLVGQFEPALDPVSGEAYNLIRNNPSVVLIPVQNDVRPFLAITDVFVHPSYREGFPNSVLEAGAMGLPCIVTNINGSNEIIQDGVNGIIIEKQNADQLKNALRLMHNDVSFRTSMAEVSQSIIAERFNRKLVQGELLKLYSGL